jgi:hypothetical protein
MVPSERAANRPSEHIEGVSYVPHFHPCSCRSEWRRSIFDPPACSLSQDVSRAAGAVVLRGAMS